MQETMLYREPIFKPFCVKRSVDNPGWHEIQTYKIMIHAGRSC